MTAATAYPTPFLESLTEEQINKAVSTTRAAIDEKREQIDQLSADLTRLTREYLALDQEQLRRRTRVPQV